MSRLLFLLLFTVSLGYSQEYYFYAAAESDDTVSLISFDGETIKLGVFSLVNGLKPLKLAPVFFKAIKSEITSSTLAYSKTLSIVSLLIKPFNFSINIVN